MKLDQNVGGQTAVGGSPGLKPFSGPSFKRTDNMFALKERLKQRTETLKFELEKKQLNHQETSIQMNNKDDIAAKFKKKFKQKILSRLHPEDYLNFHINVLK